MERSYGALGLRNSPFLSIFTPIIFPRVPGETPHRMLAVVQDLPRVKDQGDMPVCAAVAALTLYEQLLLRENLRRTSSRPAGELGWAWTYLSGRAAMEQAAGVSVAEEQLLAGLPLEAALQALVDRGVLWDEAGFCRSDPFALEEQLRQLAASPRTFLAVPLRVLALTPTAESLYDAVAAQHSIAFAFAVTPVTDEWMRSPLEQSETGYELPSPLAGSVRLATHAAVITAVDLGRERVTVQNSFGEAFGTMGFFFILFRDLFQPEFAGLRFFVLLRAG